MGLHVGIIGLPNVGKSTLFNALTKQAAKVSNFPFTTIEPNIGVVPVPDQRVEQLAKIMGSAKTTPTTIEFVDIAGLVKNAHKGEGLGNEFLSHIREVDAIIHVVRFFEDNNVPHIHDTVDSINDAKVIKTELELADLQTAERMKEKGTTEEHEIPKLSKKPMLYVANLSETQLEQHQAAISAGTNAPLDKGGLGGISKLKGIVIPISIKIEQELTELPEDERSTFLQEYGLEQTGLDRLITASYKLLDLITFFTANKNEAHAWTLRRGAKAPQAAGQVHTDMEQGFIRAETISYEDLITAGSYANARAKGLLRDEGKDYIVQDGDVMLFKHAP